MHNESILQESGNDAKVPLITPGDRRCLPSGIFAKVRGPAALRTLAALLLFFASPPGALADESFQMIQVVLLQPDFVLQERVASVDAFAAYVQEIERSVAEAVRSLKPHVPSGGFLVVAVKPGRRSNAWLDLSPSLPRSAAQKLKGAVTAVKPVPVNGGPVAFALNVRIRGGKESSAPFPSPLEWRAAAKDAGRPLETDEVLGMIWPD